MQEGAMAPEQQIVVRKMDSDLWARFKAQAALERKTISALLAEIIRDYLARQQG
jgi:hypothetical protein